LFAQNFGFRKLDKNGIFGLFWYNSSNFEYWVLHFWQNEFKFQTDSWKVYDFLDNLPFEL
jgi:hypothetical protein